MNEALKPYLARSFGLHLLGFVVFSFLLARSSRHADKVYMIDFVGGAPTIASAGSPAAASAASRASAPAEIAPQADPDSVAVKGKRHGPIALPRPSLLHGGGKDADAGTAPSGSLAGPSGAAPSAASAASPGGASGAAAGAGVATDLPNFPYPWYISQVRQMLWAAWQKRMPRADADGSVAFSILRNGTFTDLAVESSSGDADFDKAALESVQAAAPFPALPAAFGEPFLKIHLSLKSEEAWR
jgi:TonB family protein